MADFHKAGGIIITDKKLLVARSKGKNFFIAPGGKLKFGETSKQALVRELQEEFKINVNEDDLDNFGTYYAQAAGDELNALRMDVFIVTVWKGELIPDHEIEEIRWISSDIPKDMEVGSIFEHEVIPRLKRADLIN